MATYYITTIINNENVVYAMNVTTEISRTLEGTLSTHKLEDGKYSSDNYRNDPTMISFSGIISDIFVGNSLTKVERKRTKDFIEGLEKIKQDKIPFTVYYSSDLAPANICYFKSFRHRQNAKYSFSGSDTDGNHTNAYLVDMTIQVARISQGAVFTVAKADEFIDPTQDKEESSRSTKRALSPEEQAVYDAIRLRRESAQSISNAL